MRTNPERNIIVIVFMFLSLAGLSGYVAYSYMQKQPSVVKIDYQQKQQLPPAPQPSPPVEQPAGILSVAPAVEQPEKQLTEKNPFKAEFLKRFEKKVKKAENITPPPPLILPPPPPQPQQTEAKQAVETEPNINIKGVYKVKDEIIAITDKGDLKIGHEINGHKIKEITMDGKIIWEKADAKNGSNRQP